MTTKPIEGQVASILTPRELVINAGGDKGVQVGMRFAVLNRQGINIVDPATTELLGSVPIAKVLVEIVRVEPKLSVARTFNKRRVNVGGAGALGRYGLETLFAPPKYVDEWETLRTNQKPQAQELPEKDSYVKTGDPVVQVLGNEYVGVSEGA